MNYIFLSVCREFSHSPGSRYIADGPNSGEEFLKKLLEPKFLEAREKSTVLVVNLDGAIGYATSFLDGSFGELARKYGAKEVLQTLELICHDEPPLIHEIKGYITERL